MLRSESVFRSVVIAAVVGVAVVGAAASRSALPNVDGDLVLGAGVGVVGIAQRDLERVLAGLDAFHRWRVGIDMDLFAGRRLDDLVGVVVAVEVDMYVMQAGVGRAELLTRIYDERERHVEAVAVRGFLDRDTRSAAAAASSAVVVATTTGEAECSHSRQDQQQFGSGHGGSPIFVGGGIVPCPPLRLRRPNGSDASATIRPGGPTSA